MRRRLAMSALVASLLLAGCATMPSAPPVTTTVAKVDLPRYLGTWYELGSVKQFFSVGLSDSTANYSLSDDGKSVVVVNRGRYADLGNIESIVIGSAVPVDDTFAKLNVSFSGFNSAQPPGNYWIVDLDSDYQWAIVSDPTGQSGFILSRSKTVTPAFYQELVAKAADAGVNVTYLTPTPQR